MGLPTKKNMEKKKKERDCGSSDGPDLRKKRIMVEILRFGYDGTSFEDDEDLKDMKFFFRKKNFRFLLLRFLGNQTEGRCVRTQNLHFTIQKAVK